MPDAVRVSMDRSRLIKTIDDLRWRISERFPTSNLRHVCAELLEVAKRIDTDLEYIERPNWWLRGGIVAFVAFVVAVFAYGSLATDFAEHRLTMVDLIQIAESSLNDFVLIGAAIVFLVSVEVRAKRHRVIAAVNRLRSIAHVVDLHQLTKDPSVLESPPTAHSPKRDFSTADLGRYLDYCSEILALTSKVGFCYVQDFDDSEANHAINELEVLTTGLSGKIWQKIMLLDRDRVVP